MLKAIFLPLLIILTVQLASSQTLLDSLLENAKHTVFSDYPKTMATTAEIIRLGKAEKKPLMEAAGWNIRGVVFQYTGRHDSALVCFKETYRLGSENRDQLTIMKALQNTGSTYFKLANYAMAVNIGFEALKLAESRKDSAAAGKIYGDLSNSFIMMKKYAVAITYLNKALAYTLKFGDPAATGNLYNSLGTAYSDMGNKAKAKTAFAKALSVAKKYDNKKGQLSAFINLASKTGTKNGAAVNYLLLAEKLATGLNDRSSLANIYTNLATDYFELKMYRETGFYLDKAVTLSKITGEKDYLKENLMLKSRLQYLNGNQHDAYTSIKESIRLKDSIYNENVSRQVTEIETKYQTAKKQQQIQLLNKENTIQKLSLANRNNTIAIFLLVFAALSVAALQFHHRNKLKQEALLKNEIIKQQGLATRAVLEAEERERERIAGDLHDGVGQLFSTVKMNLSGIEDQLSFKDSVSKDNFQKTMLLVDESCREVRSISHQMAPNVLLKSGLVSAVRDFITKVDERRLKINLEVQGLNSRLDSNVETVLYRVIQETVNNVIKHAGASRLDIQLLKDDDGLSAMIEDNGIGFDTQNNSITEGMGIKNILSRINYLNGSVDFDSIAGTGTVVSIWIPV